ncbi:MAG: acyl-CoA dehydrogenase [Candidatus Binataceae bacterium]
MDLSFSEDEERFRQRVRAFMQANLPEGWGTAAYKQSAGDDVTEVQRDWTRQLHQAGFLGMAWPKEYGGQGASQIELAIFNEEAARVRAPNPINGVGLILAGPTIMAHGTEEQKKRFLPKILSGEELWCQGFSEPNAGSDLASLRTRAELVGDEFIVNGQKCWTTMAHVADWCILMVRTDPTAPKHRGISYLLVDMKTPGVMVKPLKQMTGGHEFNEIFFDSVRVPRSNLLGELNGGWRVGVTTLMNERGTSAFAVWLRFRITFDELVEMARPRSRQGRPALQDPVIRQQLAQIYIDLEGLRYISYRTFSQILKGGTPGPEGSISKVVWSELNQRMNELAVNLQGPGSQLVRKSAYAIDDGRWQFTFLRSRANTIEAGTSEIQRNIIAQRVLGLPKTN